MTPQEPDYPPGLTAGERDQYLSHWHTHLEVQAALRAERQATEIDEALSEVEDLAETVSGPDDPVFSPRQTPTPEQERAAEAFWAWQTRQTDGPGYGTDREIGS